MIKDKTVVITGSTSGIGLGIATAFAAKGANVVLNGLGDATEIEQTRASLAKEHGVKVLYHPANMLDPKMIEAMISHAHKELGSVDVLINNAGIQHVAPIDEFPPEKWEAIIGINLVSAFHTIRATLPLMKQKGWGRIINIASAHAMVASPYKSAYVAAKHGIAGLTKSVALEVAQQQITVNAICPGYVKTPLVENQIADTAKARGMSEEDVINNVLLGAQPTKQFTTVDQISGLAMFLCSDDAANITGSLQAIDGGWTAA